MEACNHSSPPQCGALVLGARTHRQEASKAVPQSQKQPHVPRAADLVAGATTASVSIGKSPETTRLYTPTSSTWWGTQPAKQRIVRGSTSQGSSSTLFTKQLLPIRCCNVLAHVRTSSPLKSSWASSARLQPKVEASPK
ncbi:hypothetical protein HaLaN_13789 [Haematococcus lacustris]|uniref:Uncharacterized protein n=1 Tax=Haematococcus lacustris TaxID=44745 RepID=A0A699ZD41_HAELA|nr:hypothetical protein HaLaN_13789 [Haematococcus lacustris]